MQISDLTYDRINDYAAVHISLANSEDILGWSLGEVKKPETINYRTYRAEKDGLFCERIFGPERDWECFCGKYKGIKHKGTICDRCGVLVTHSRVRRKRMGHIKLASPVAHIWFFKAMPSRMGALLGMKTSSLERVLYFQDYVVTDPGDTPLIKTQLLNEEDYREARDKYGDKFEAGMGAESTQKLLEALDLVTLAVDLREDLAATRSKQKHKDILKRLELVEAIRDSKNEPTWMVYDVIPVIPPDLRPLVLLDSGNFATSDLNDLYRRLINRNNRLKNLIDLNAPDVIIINEKRMLQQSVDALFDNARCRRSVLGSNNRPLKSLTDMIKGKQGRFRENLLGKRVDYSARSVIVVGPELKLHQCGLPKKIALELFQPFIIRRLKELGHADTIKSAKKMLERKDEEVWDILEEVIQAHPVMLNRAPTLHRMGIQAFEPKLVEGNAIYLHPLVCSGFNADFDGDQMAVHLPLSLEAQVEARTLMLSTNNIFSPANGKPVISPSQDMVMGLNYLTINREDMLGDGKIFMSVSEAILAYSQDKLHLHANLKVRIDEGVLLSDGKELSKHPGGLLQTTVGRLLFHDMLPDNMPIYNLVITKGLVGKVISECNELLGTQQTLVLLDNIKALGFKMATRSGVSLAVDDLKIPKKKVEIITTTENKVKEITGHYEDGVITDGERYNQIIDEWTHARELIAGEMMETLRSDTRDGRSVINPVYMMVNSGSRGSLDQVRQLAGMRGLMAKPSGQIIETPIKANFREGLRVLEYFSSTHGARKGLADTALKTADSGYLTRKLSDVAQHVVVTQDDCGTLKGITKSIVMQGDKLIRTLGEGVIGRVARDNIVNIITDEVVVKENEIFTAEIAKNIDVLGYDKIRVRSQLTCESNYGVCATCYGMDRSTNRMVEKGLAVGIIAAQSIGEPGTQLTMRTFHIGGTASRAVEASEIRAGREGSIKYDNLKIVVSEKKQIIVLNRNGNVLLTDKKGRTLESYPIPAGAVLTKEEGAKVKKDQILAQWDPHNTPVIANCGGIVHYEELIEGVTFREEQDARSKRKRKVIMESKGAMHPQIVIRDSKEEILAVYPIPEKAHLEVNDNQKIKPGALLAKTPRGMSGTQDITGGLPRVTEIFEARKPKSESVIAEISGVIRIGDKKRGKMTIIVSNDAMEAEHVIPHGKNLRVQTGDIVEAGEGLVDGSVVPRDLLRIKGEEALQDYLIREVQNVYRSQNVTIDDKHIEIIISQMMGKVLIEDAGESDYLPGQVIGRVQFRLLNEGLKKEKKKPIIATPQLMGITKAALQSESFISAASFQETTKVLTQAALAGKIDLLRGLKENVILGHMIPAGTGFKDWVTSYAKKMGAEIQDEVVEVEEDEEGAESEGETTAPAAN